MKTDTLLPGQISYELACELTKQDKAEILRINRGKVVRRFRGGGRSKPCFYFDNYLHAYAHSFKEPEDTFYIRPPDGYVLDNEKNES